MNLNELSSLTEIVASVAVLITLIFLVLQMRQNTKILIRSNARQTASDTREALQSLLDKEVSELFLRGHNQGLSSLSLEERYRFDVAFCIWLQATEQAFADFREGAYPADHLVAYENSVPGFLSTPGGSAWWKERKVWFSHEFRKEVEIMIKNYDGESLNAGPPTKSEEST